MLGRIWYDEIAQLRKNRNLRARHIYLQGLTGEGKFFSLTLCEFNRPVQITRFDTGYARSEGGMAEFFKMWADEAIGPDSPHCPVCAARFSIYLGNRLYEKSEAQVLKFIFDVLKKAA
jgi:hypothetical protein